jgi:hypothetical protein
MIYLEISISLNLDLSELSFWRNNALLNIQIIKNNLLKEIHFIQTKNKLLAKNPSLFARATCSFQKYLFDFAFLIKPIHF